MLIMVACLGLVAVLAAGVLSGTVWTTSAHLLAAVAVLVLSPRVRPLAGVARRLAPWLGGVAGALLVMQLTAVLIQGNFGRAHGLLPHANTAAAAALTLWALLVVGLADDHKGRPMRISGLVFVVLGSVVAGFLILMAGSRALMLGALAGGLLAIVIAATSGLKLKGWLVAVIGMVGCFMGLAAINFMRGDLDSVLGSFERGPIFMTALEIAMLSPLTGLGDGAWFRWAPIVEPSLPLAAAAHTHSVPLEVLLGGGAVGLASFLILYALAVSSLFQHVRARVSLGGLSLLATVTALSVQGLVDLAVLHPAVYTPLAFVVAIWGLVQVRGKAEGVTGA